jgi:hypothetical protein
VMSAVRMPNGRNVPKKLGTFCPFRDKNRGRIVRPHGNALSRGRFVQGTVRTGDGSSRGRIVQGTDRPGDGSSKGRIVQGTDCPGDVSSGDASYGDGSCREGSSGYRRVLRWQAAADSNW